MKMLQSQRKLCLVLDLDHTLLNSTVLRDLRPEEEYLKSLTHSLEGNIPKLFLCVLVLFHLDVCMCYPVLLSFLIFFC